jgi:GNAT superfamily N-acetyltransferase
LDGTTVAGFISGCRDTRTTFRKVILKTLVALAMFAAGMLFRFRLMQFLRIMLYPLRKGTSSSHASAVCTGIRAELLSVVVSDDYQKRGLGKLLLDTVDDTMREWNVPGFYRVASDLSVAGSQQFYLRSGFQPCHTLTLNDTVLQVYIKEIPGTEIG